MKKLFSFAIVALGISINANAQIGESKSKKIETTYTTTTHTVVDDDDDDDDKYDNYNRIHWGYAPTKIKQKDEAFTGWISKRMLHGFDYGWTGGFNITGKHQPIYLEPGVIMAIDFKDGEKLMFFELPVSFTYRLTLGSSKVRIAPYFGFHFKVNALWTDTNDNNNFNLDGSKRFQVGLQTGVNFDINHFYVGAGWEFDINPIYNGLGTYTYGGTFDLKEVTRGARVRLGVVF